MSNSLLHRVRAFIGQQRLLSPDGRYLVAVSGGADSVCLLLMLLQMGYEVEAVHCNFKLRGDESQRDEDFVKGLCQRLGVKLHLTHFDTREYAAMRRISIEMAARQLRYAYFEQLRRDIDAADICVAHHQDDAVETFLMNLIRGTGIHGLTGIKPRNGHIVRPLLCLSRQDILLWLDEQHQTFVTDSSNMVADIVRNKLRLNVIPQLLDITPAASSSILTTARHLQEAEKVYQQAVSQALDRLLADDAVDISQLLAEPSPEAILYHWLAPYGFSSDMIEAISQRLPEAQGGRSWMSASHMLAISQGRLMLTTIPQERPTMRIPEPGTYVYDEGQERFRITIEQGIHIKRDSHFACLDASRVTFPLTLRPIRQGDRFQPFGMKGTKLVSDYLADQKVAPADRRRQLVLTDCNCDIIWLVDRRPDGRFTVSGDTVSTLLISHIPTPDSSNP